MKITADKISAQLARGLAPVYFVSGDEPLLLGEAIDQIRAAAREQGFDERESHVADARFDWDRLRGGLDNMSLFASRKIVEVRLATGKPGRAGGAAITEIVSQPPADTLFIISSPQIDKRTSAAKWVKTLEQKGVWATVYGVSPERLPGWIAQRAKVAGITLDTEAIAILADRTEGNLLAAQQEISKLVLLAAGEPVSASMVLQSVADGARFDVYQLADAACGQESARAVRILYGLRAEGVAAPLVLWALVREINVLASIWARMEQGESMGQAMNAARVWRNRQPLISKALRQHNEQSLRRLLRSAGVADRVVKGARQGQPWNALLELVLMMAQPRAALRAGYAA